MIRGFWSEPLDHLKIVDLKVDLSYDVHIGLKFVIEFCDYDANIPSEIDDHFKDKAYKTQIINPVTMLHLIESWIWRNNTDETINITSLDLLSALSQKYLSFLLTKLINVDMGIALNFIIVNLVISNITSTSSFLIKELMYLLLKELL